MIRASDGDKAYWDSRVKFYGRAVGESWETISQPSQNPGYRPQYILDTGFYALRGLLARYSRGDAVTELGACMGDVIRAWEMSNHEAGKLQAQSGKGTRWDHRRLWTAPQATDDSRGHSDPRAWVFDLRSRNHYNWCFWLVGLALVLDLPEDPWRRLIALVGSEGQDELLDRVIASRDPGRVIGRELQHTKPYARLLRAANAPQDQQARLLHEFVAHWYSELAGEGLDEVWWHNFANLTMTPLERGSYFGCWCIEAVAAVKAFGLDDSLCLGHPHYPGDLLRPNGPTTHPAREEPRRGMLGRLLSRWRASA